MAKAFLVLFFVCFAGCSKEEGARKEFSKHFTCPEDQVEVRERKELKPSMLRVKLPPPPEIASDPARLELYKEQQAEIDEGADTFGDIYEARGCDKQSLYACRIRSNKTFGVSCTTQPYVDGVSRW
jgi:hypothetical protein